MSARRENRNNERGEYRVEDRKQRGDKRRKEHSVY